MKDGEQASVPRRIHAWMHWLRKRSDYVAALFFVALQALVLLSFLLSPPTWVLLFWYCNNVSFFYAIAFYERNHQFVKGLNYVGLLPQLLWVSDFTSHIFGFDLSNTSNYVFLQGFTFSNDVTILLHLTMPFIALAYTLRERPHPRSLLYSLVYIIGLYAVTIAGTLPEDDINCVWNACSSYVFSYHILLWPLYLMILSTASYFLHLGLFRLYGNVARRLQRASASDTLQV